MCTMKPYDILKVKNISVMPVYYVKKYTICNLVLVLLNPAAAILLFYSLQKCTLNKSFTLLEALLSHKLNYPIKWGQCCLHLRHSHGQNVGITKDRLLKNTKGRMTYSSTMSIPSFITVHHLFKNLSVETNVIGAA